MTDGRRAPVLVLGAMMALAGCDTLFGPSARAPAEVALSSVPGSVAAGATIDGITATVRDSDGKAVAGAMVEWVAVTGTVDPVSGTTDATGATSTSWTVGTTAGPQLLRARVGGLEATGSVSVMPGPLATLMVTPGSVHFESVGDTVLLSVEGTDAHGNGVSTHSLTWTSSAPSVASVADGRVISRSNGTAVITAGSAGVSEPVSVVVDQVMAALTISAPMLRLVPEETLGLRALAVDARGSAIDTTFAASWSSSEPGVATVDEAGVVTAGQPGSTVIAAHAGGHSAEITLEVAAGTRPSIAAITPAVLSPGDTATITGNGFSSTPSVNLVTVAGYAAQVVSAASTELRVAVPGPETFACSPTVARPVVVSVDGFETAVDHPLAGAPQRALSVGQSVSLLGGDAACNELGHGGTYLVSVFNTTNSPTAETGFKLRGTTPVTATDATATVLRRQYRHSPPLPRLERDLETETHTWLLEENARIGHHLAGRGRPAAVPAPGPWLAASVAPGTTRTFRIPDLDTTASLCANYLTVTARAVYVGERSVIWEDQAAPLAGQMDARWEEVGREYETVMHPIIEDYFGDPLAYDPWLANSGRVHMLFSRKVNDFERAVNGFVFSGDFFPTSQCAQSNGSAMFYGRVPTDPGAGYTGNTADVWAWSMRATIIHEVKHVASYATRLRLWAEGHSLSPNYEATWLEESTARLAEEFYARALMGYGQGDNVTYEASIWCERRVLPNFPDCDPIPAIVYKHFGAVYQYYRNVEGLSPLGPAVQRDGTFYGSGWLLVRWAMDHSGMSEQAFSRALVHEASLTGVANLSARTGRSFPAMLADFTLAMITDDHPSGVTTAWPALAFPSWNTRDIMHGMYEDHQGGTLAGVYDVPWPLSTRALGFGDFDADVTGIRGGSATFFELTGPAGGRLLLQLLSPGGNTAAANLGVAIVRVN